MTLYLTTHNYITLLDQSITLNNNILCNILSTCIEPSWNTITEKLTQCCKLSPDDIDLWGPSGAPGSSNAGGWWWVCAGNKPNNSH